MLGVVLGRLGFPSTFALLSFFSSGSIGLLGIKGTYEF
jgi:hypothetical protein